METEEREPEKELTNIRPSKVSLVTEGANGQFLFVVKSKSKKGTSEIQEDSFKKQVVEFTQSAMNTIGSIHEWLSGVETDDSSDVPVSVISVLSRIKDDFVDMRESIKSGGNRLVDVKISGEKRDKLLTALDVLAEKISVSLEAIGDEEDVSEEFDECIKNVISGFDVVIGSYDKDNEEESEKVEDEVWSTSYMNELPDSAFLYIVPGGEKDSDEKTVPRTNRMFPYKDKEGKVDLPHLRNAIARIPQSSLSKDLKDKLQEKARNILAEVDKSESKQEEKGMSVKIAEIAKSAAKVDLDQVEVKKAVASASAKLQELASLLAIDVDEAKKMENYDLRWKLGDAADILVRAAKLEEMLGSSASSEPTETEMAAPENEEDKKPEEEEEVPVEKAKEPPQTQDLVVVLKSAFGEMIAPISEKLNKIETDLTSTTEKVEKIERTRTAPKGEGVVVTQVSKSENENGGQSLFAGIMPPHLRGKATRS